MFRRMLALALLGLLVVGSVTTLYGTARGIPTGSILTSLVGQGGEHGHGSHHDDD